MFAIFWTIPECICVELHQGLSQGCDPLPVYGKIILLRLLKGEINHENKQKNSYYFNTLHSFIAYSLRRKRTAAGRAVDQKFLDGNRQQYTDSSNTSLDDLYCSRRTRFLQIMRLYGKQGIRHVMSKSGAYL